MTTLNTVIETQDTDDIELGSLVAQGQFDTIQLLMKSTLAANEQYSQLAQRALKASKAAYLAAIVLDPRNEIEILTSENNSTFVALKPTFADDVKPSLRETITHNNKYAAVPGHEIHSKTVYKLEPHEQAALEKLSGKPVAALAMRPQPQASKTASLQSGPRC